MNKCILSVDAGGTYLKAALVTHEGEIIADTFMKVPVNSDGELEKIVESYKTLATMAKEKAESFWLSAPSIKRICCSSVKKKGRLSC